MKRGPSILEAYLSSTPARKASMILKRFILGRPKPLTTPAKPKAAPLRSPYLSETLSLRKRSATNVDALSCNRGEVRQQPANK